MDLSLLNILILVGISQGFLLSVLLILRCKRLLITLPLLIYVLLMTVELVDVLLLSLGFHAFLLGFAHLTEVFNVMYGMLIFMYVRNIIAGKMVIKRSDWLLLIPVVAYSLYYILMDHDCSVTYNAKQIVAKGVEYSAHLPEWIGEVLIGFVFLGMAYGLLRRHIGAVRRRSEAVVADELRTFLVARVLVLLTFSVYVVEAILIVLLLCGIPCAHLCYDFIYGCYLLMLIGFGYVELVAPTTWGWSVSGIQSAMAALGKGTGTGGEDVTRAKRKTSVDQPSCQRIGGQIVACMREQKPYLDPEMTLKKMADLVGEPSHVVSQVINDCFSQNYNEFINTYRIEDAKNMLHAPEKQNYTFETIGFEVGFNSKSAFYSSFKKVTGMTPSEYKQSIQ